MKSNKYSFNTCFIWIEYAMETHNFYDYNDFGLINF